MFFITIEDRLKRKINYTSLLMFIGINNDISKIETANDSPLN